jgi:hypothetical protein
MIHLALVFKEKYDDDLICDAIIDPESHSNDVVQMFMEGSSSYLLENEYNNIPTYIYLASPITTNFPIQISLVKTVNYNPRLENLQKKQLIELFKSVLVHLHGNLPI